MKYEQMCKEILAAVGGKENIKDAYHCMTRLRINVKDTAKADLEALKKVKGIMKVVVTAPEEYMGDVMGDINARRGQISGSDIRNGAAVVECSVPLSTMFGYATDLRSKTQGRATYSMEPSHFVELPKNLQESLVNTRNGFPINRF